MKLTPERKAEQKIAARWGRNVQRLLKEKGLKMCELGRLLDPDNSNPTGHVFNLVRRHTMPDDKTCCTVASFLGVSKEALHMGELREVGGSAKRRVMSDERGMKTRTQTIQRPETRDQNAELRTEPELTTKTPRHQGSDVEGLKGSRVEWKRRLDSSHFRRDRRPGPEGRLTTKTQRHKEGPGAETGAGDEEVGEDPVMDCVMEVVRGRVIVLEEPKRTEFVRALARLCGEYEAG